MVAVPQSQPLASAHLEQLLGGACSASGRCLLFRHSFALWSTYLVVQVTQAQPVSSTASFPLSSSKAVSGSLDERISRS